MSIGGFLEIPAMFMKKSSIYKNICDNRLTYLPGKIILKMKKRKARIQLSQNHPFPVSVITAHWTN